MTRDPALSLAIRESRRFRAMALSMTPRVSRLAPQGHRQWTLPFAERKRAP